MKLHLPVKLRASLIAAVIAVSASVYNAYGANTYTEFGNNDHVFTSATPGLSGNTYVAEEATKTYYYADDTKAVAIAQGADGTWFELDAEGALTETEYVPTDPATWTPYTETVTDDGYLTFEVSSPAQGTTTYETQFEGNTSLTADVVQFNNSVVTKGDEVAGPTSITANDAIEVNSRPVAGYSAVALENVSIQTPATKLSSDSELSIDNTAAADSVLDLGAVSGKGSLYITGSDVASMDSVNLENLGNLGLTGTTASVDGLVAVNDLKIVGSTAEIEGDVTVGGTLNVDADSAIVAEGDISSRTTTGTGSVEAIDGSITSTGGNIYLDNCSDSRSITGTIAATSTEEGKGNISLNNIAVKDGATINASGDLTLTGNSTITDTPNDGGTPDDTSDDNGSIMVSVGGNLTVDDSAITGTDMTVEGDVAVNNGASIEGGSIDGADNVTVSGGSTVTDTALENVSGTVTVENGSISGGSISGAEGDGIDGIVVDGENSTIDGVGITGNVGNITVQNGGALTNSTIDGGEHLLLNGANGADLTGTTIANLTGDIKIASITQDGLVLSTQGTSTDAVNDLDPGLAGGSIIIDSSILSNSTIKSGVAVADGAESAVTGAGGAIKVNNSDLDTVILATQSGDVTVGSDPLIVNAGSTTFNDKGVTKKFKTSLTRLGVQAREGSVAVLESVSIVERNTNANDAYTGAVKLKITAADGTSYISINSQEFDHNSSINSFEFDSVEIDPSADYTFTFVDATDETTEKNVGVSLIPNDVETSKISEANHSIVVAAQASIYNSIIAGTTITTGEGDVSITGTKATASTITTGAGALSIGDSAVAASTVTTESGDVTIDASEILASTITTAEGALTVTESIIASDTLAGTDAEGNATETYSKSILSATGKSSITDSEVSGADISISGGTLDIVSSSITGDVNVLAQSVAVKNGTTIAIDGGEAHDASIVANGTGNEGNLWMGNSDSLAGNVANISNADVQVSGTTTIYGADTINLTNVYKKGEDANTASALGTVNNNGDAAAAATLNIDGSIINMAAIHANGGGDGTDVSKYFGTVKLDKASNVNVIGSTAIESLTVNAKKLESTEQSTMVIGGDAHLKSVLMYGEGDNDATSKTTSSLVIKGAAHIGSLETHDGSALSLVNAEALVAGKGTLVTPVSDKVSTIADIKNMDTSAMHGTINVVGGTLVTPTLNNTISNPYLSLGLNGGIVELGEVAVIGDAIDASTVAPDYAVRLRYLTDAAQTGVTDTIGESTIRMARLQTITGYASAEAGTDTPVEGAKAYMYKVNCGQDNTVTVAEGMKLYKQNADGAWVELAAGETLNDGDVVAKFNYKFTTSTLETGAVVNTGAEVDETLAGLTDAEDDFLEKMTATLVDGENTPMVGETVTIDGKDYVVAAQGQLVQAVDASYKTGASATLGTTEIKNDGIGSLHLKKSSWGGGGDMSANKTTINAYELATISKYWKDGIEMSVADYDALSDADKAGWMPEYAAVANTGFITIEGKLTGSDNTLTADKNISVGGIEASGNTLTSNRGDVSITANGITGSNNKLTSTTGAVSVSGIINGNDNVLTAENGTITTGAITSADDATAAGEEGKGNTLTAAGDIVTGAITGDCNELTSQTGSISTGAIDGEYNELSAATSITTGAITGDVNTLEAGQSIRIGGTLVGSNNTIVNNATVDTTGNAIEITAGVGGNDAASNGNTITAAKGNIRLGGTNSISLGGNNNTVTAQQGNITLTNKIKGDANELKATGGGSIDIGNLESSADATDYYTEGGTKGNKLTADGSIKLNQLIGDANKLTAETDSILFKNGAKLEGDYNELTAATTITASAITGHNNILTAKGDVVDGDGATLTTGAINGTGNELKAENGDIKTSAITGNDNTLTALDNITTGAINGTGNELTAETVIIDGVLQGSDNTVDAGTIQIDELSGSGHEIISSGVTVTKDNAIVIDKLTSADSTVKVEDISGAVGSIYIGEMATGTEVGTTGNVITTPQGNVTIGKLTGANARTNITVGSRYSITVEGAEGQTEINTASNQNWEAGSLVIDAATGLALTDSTVDVDKVKGTSLELKGASELTADTVELDSLSIAGTSWVDADKVTVDDLTLDGANATLKGDPVITVTDSLTLTNGAVLVGSSIKTDGSAVLEVIDSTLTTGMLEGFSGVTLQNSTGTVTSGLTGLTEDVHAKQNSTLTANEISTSKQVIADDSTIATTKGGISADNGVTATNGGVISSAGGITSSAAGVNATEGGKIEANGAIVAKTITADNGTINNGSNDITAGSMEIANGGSITTGAVTLTGALNAAGGKLTAASVSGATGAKLNGASITGALAMSGTDADVNATGGSIGSITGANDVTANGTNVGAIAMTGKLDATNGTIASVSGATGAELDGTIITGELNSSGTVEADGGSIGSITGAATTVDLDGTAVGDITMSTTGNLIVKDTTTGAVNAADGNTVANATLTDTTIGSGLNVTNNMTTTGDVTVNGDVNVGNDLSVNTGTLTADNVTVNGTTTLTGGEVDVEGTFHSTEVKLVDIEGAMAELKADKGLSLSGAVVTISGMGGEAVKVAEGGMTLTNSASVTNAGGASIAGGLTVDESSFTNKEAVSVTGKTEVTDWGVLTGAGLTTDGLEVDENGEVTIEGAIDLNNGGLTASKDAVVTAKGGSITEAGAVSITDGAKVIADTVTGATTVGVTTGGMLVGSVTASDAVTVNDGDITGSVTTTGGVSVTDGTIGGTVDAGSDVMVSKGSTGTVTAGGAVKVTEGGVVNGIAKATTVTVDKGAKVTGDVAGATGTVTVDNALVTGSVTTDGGAGLSGATINGALSAGDTTVGKDSKVGSAAVGALSVATGATLTADGDVTTAGDLEIAGKVVSNTGDITLAGNGTVSADVTAAAGKLSIEGNLEAANVVLTGETLDIGGTLNAGKGVSLAGEVGGVGSIVKSGGDTLVLAGDTEIGGVSVKGSTLNAGDDAHLGELNLAGSTLSIAGDGTMGRVYVNGGSIDSASTVKADVKLGQRSGVDAIINNGTMRIDGAKVVLNDLGTNEANVADQQSVRLVDGKVTGAGFAADVQHSFDTLNVHAEGGEIVFSKNYKGAENKTENQSATADALAALTAPTGELAAAVDALNHTRSAAEALKALDSLNGAGLAAAPKLVADETKEHLQTLRSTIRSVAAGLERRFDANGRRLPDVESTAVTAAVTGGNATVNADDNAAEYNRDSMGAMFTVAHAINAEWTFAAALSVSQADADCGNTTLESQGIFLDVGVMQKRGRFSQMGSIGCAFFSMDTERTVGVNAPGHAFAGTAEGSTDAAAFTMTYETSYAIWQTETYSLSSVVMAEMLFAQVDNMEEEGMGNAGLRSSFDDVAAFTFGVGGRYTYHFGAAENPGYFSLEAMFVADAGDSVTKVNNTFIGGGNSFQLSGPDAGNYGLRLNAGLLVPVSDQWSVFGNVTGEIRAEQTNVGASAGLKYAF